MYTLYVGGRNKPIGKTLNTPPQIPEADKFKKPYIKVGRDSCLWDSGRWDGWEIIIGLISLFFATSDLTKHQKH